MSAPHRRTPWLSPAGAALAVICFFMPWVRVSCLGDVDVSGARLGGELWLVPIAGLTIILAVYFMRSVGETARAAPLVTGAALVGIGVMALKLVRFISGVDTAIGRVSPKDVGFELQFGALGSALGLLLALIGTSQLERADGATEMDDRPVLGRCSGCRKRLMDMPAEATVCDVCATPLPVRDRDAVPRRQGVTGPLEANATRGEPEKLARRQHLEAILTQDPLNHDGRLELGLILAEEGDFEGALVQLHRVCEGLPERADARLHLASIYERLQRWEKALDQIDRAAVLQPGIAEIPERKAHALERAGRLKDAIELLRSASTRDPSNVSLLSRRVHLLERVAPVDLDEVILLSQRILEIQPQDVEAQSTLAAALAKAGRKHESIEAYRRVLALDPADPDAAIAVGEHELDAGADRAEVGAIVAPAWVAGRIDGSARTLARLLVFCFRARGATNSSDLAGLLLGLENDSVPIERRVLFSQCLVELAERQCAEEQPASAAQTLERLQTVPDDPDLRSRLAKVCETSATMLSRSGDRGAAQRLISQGLSFVPSDGGLLALSAVLGRRRTLARLGIPAAALGIASASWLAWAKTMADLSVISPTDAQVSIEDDSGRRVKLEARLPGESTAKLRPGAYQVRVV